MTPLPPPHLKAAFEKTMQYIWAEAESVLSFARCTIFVKAARNPPPPVLEIDEELIPYIRSAEIPSITKHPKRTSDAPMGILQDLFKNRIIISLTAYNPGGLSQCNDLNIKANRALEKELHEIKSHDAILGFARSGGEYGPWIELGFSVHLNSVHPKVYEAKSAVLALARKYGQAAVYQLELDPKTDKVTQAIISCSKEYD
eukprot:TRINITY_DN26020_c0_g1_i1.p1 TRINITY_DN26020_c0_g1~~TRINITY_DN26020_c0_g1_i1.p1  ORF type:complete len:201 (-),score=29.52 TRINITY_DN26020_c0_g1_i1:3-605(-)